MHLYCFEKAPVRYLRTTEKIYWYRTLLKGNVDKQMNIYFRQRLLI